MGGAAVAGELVAGLVLIVLAVLVLLVAMLLWGRNYQNNHVMRNKRQSVKEGETFAMKMLTNYEEMEDTETGYYRYSDPIDHRSTVTTASQVALDKAHVAVHPQEPPSLGAQINNMSSGAATGAANLTSPTAKPGASRHLAELAVGRRRRQDEDAVSDVYEEYSCVMVDNEEEEEEEKHQRAEALRIMMEENRPNHGSTAQKTSRLPPPVVIRVHRKESDHKKPQNIPERKSPRSDQSPLGDQYVYLYNQGIECDPLMSRPLMHPNDSQIDLDGSLNESGPDDQKGHVEKHEHDKCTGVSESSLPEECPIYANQASLTAGDYDFDSVDNATNSMETILDILPEKTAEKVEVYVHDSNKAMPDSPLFKHIGYANIAEEELLVPTNIPNLEMSVWTSGLENYGLNF
ncbi:hypothetical protein EGW08_001464, partial [Elysia chlorotica]